MQGSSACVATRQGSGIVGRMVSIDRIASSMTGTAVGQESGAPEQGKTLTFSHIYCIVRTSPYK
jgi:hypothetical protein